MLKLPVPTPIPHNVVLKPSEQQKEMVAALSERAEKVRNKMVDSSVDNMLLITNDGRKLALDQRLMSPILGDSETSKCRACADAVYDVWLKHTDMVKADDASKINRIFERFNLSPVDVGQVKSEIERQMQEQQQKKKPGDIPVPEAVPSEDKEDAFIDRLLAKPPNAEKQQNENPTDGRIAKSRQSVPTSVTKEGIARGDAEPRPSVRQELKQIREDQAQTASKSSRKKNPRAPQHQNHSHSRKRHKKTKER